MNGTTLFWELTRLYKAMGVAYNRPASLSRDEEIAEIRAAIQIAKGNLNACRRNDAALIDALLKGTK